MTLQFSFRPEAGDDLQAAYNWYEGERPGLGEDLKAAVAATLAMLAEHPQIRPVLYRGVRRVTLRRFPYSLYYFLHTDRFEVIAFLHHRRSPRVWRARAREV